MNVYVRELMRQLGRRGHLVDCFTRSQSQLVPHIPDTDLGPNVRVIHVAAGREAPLGKEGAWEVVEAAATPTTAAPMTTPATALLGLSSWWPS